jgi:hypothetical protein
MNVRSNISFSLNAQVKFALTRIGMVALLGVFAGAAGAQPFEEVYGPKDSRDRGEKRVTPVTRCAPDKGYIAVGTQAGTDPSRVYVVRTDIAGVTMWEHIFDIGNDNRPDEGFALAELEDKTGFMITGTSNRGAINSAFLLKIDCDGRPRFSLFYNPPATIPAPWRVVARDIVETRTGSPSLGTNPGDFLVAGYVDMGGVLDGYLMRVRANGAIIWQRRYNHGVNERFFGLTEASPNPLGNNATGDAVAVGEYVNTTGAQGLAVRVDGNTGLIGAAPQCAAAYGDAGVEALYSVIELKNESPHLAMVGVTDSPGLREDVFLVKTRDNPCFLINQSFIGNEDGKAYSEAGYDLVEILEPTDDSTGARVGDLAITGFAEQDSQRRDLTLLYADINFLLPISARVYGDHRGSIEEGRSIAQNFENGFVMAGFSETDWEGNGDPSDLYLVDTTNSSKTGCENKWDPKGENPRWDVRELHTAVNSVVTAQPIQTPHKRLDTRLVTCPVP